MTTKGHSAHRKEVTQKLQSLPNSIQILQLAHGCKWFWTPTLTVLCLLFCCSFLLCFSCDNCCICWPTCGEEDNRNRREGIYNHLHTSPDNLCERNQFRWWLSLSLTHTHKHIVSFYINVSKLSAPTCFRWGGDSKYGWKDGEPGIHGVWEFLSDLSTWGVTVEFLRPPKSNKFYPRYICTHSPFIWHIYFSINLLASIMDF